MKKLILLAALFSAVLFQASAFAVDISICEYWSGTVALVNGIPTNASTIDMVFCSNPSVIQSLNGSVTGGTGVLDLISPDKSIKFRSDFRFQVMSQLLANHQIVEGTGAAHPILFTQRLGEMSH